MKTTTIMLVLLTSACGRIPDEKAVLSSEACGKTFMTYDGVTYDGTDVVGLGEHVINRNGTSCSFTIDQNGVVYPHL